MGYRCPRFHVRRGTAGTPSSAGSRRRKVSAAIAANEVIAQMGTRNNASARVAGRISLFLENLVPNAELASREAEHRRLKFKVEELEKKVGADDSHERLTSILNNIFFTLRSQPAEAPRLPSPAARLPKKKIPPPTEPKGPAG